MTTTPSGNGHGDQGALASARPVVLVRYRRGLTGEVARTVHLVPLPLPGGQRKDSGAATALCGTLLGADQIETVNPGEGMPCTVCVLRHATGTRPQDREPASASSAPDTVPSAHADSTATRVAALANYRMWGWPVVLRRDQIWLRLQHDLIAVMIAAPLAEEVAAILTARRCPAAVLAHPYGPGHYVLLAGEKYGVALPWSPDAQPITGTVLLPPSTTPRGPVTWVERPRPDTLRLCREIDLFAALRTARSEKGTVAGTGCGDHPFQVAVGLARGGFVRGSHEATSGAQTAAEMGLGAPGLPCGAGVSDLNHPGSDL